MKYEDAVVYWYTQLNPIERIQISRLSKKKTILGKFRDSIKYIMNNR